MKTDQKRVWDAGYCEGLRQGKARERARLRRILQDLGRVVVIDELTKATRPR